MIPTQDFFKADGSAYMKTNRKITRAIFKEPQGFSEERPLTKLARQLMPKLEIVSVELLDQGKDMDYFEVGVVVPWSKEVHKTRGMAKDELDVYLRFKEGWEKKGYRFDDVD